MEKNTPPSPSPKDDATGEAFVSSALKVNLERTSVPVEISPKYEQLLGIVAGHYGVRKKTTELLTELHHPYINWEYVVGELKSISIGDFYIFNNHPEALSALSMLLEMFFDIIRQATTDDVKDSAIHYLFDFADTILEKSNDHLQRNLALFSDLIDFLSNLACENPVMLRKASAHLKRMIRGFEQRRIDIPHTGIDALLFHLFTATYTYWLNQPDPSDWMTPDDGENEDDVTAYQNLVAPLGHAHIRGLLMGLSAKASPEASGHDADLRLSYLNLPDYYTMIHAYLVMADRIEKSSAFAGHGPLIKLNFLFSIMSEEALADIHTAAMREINHALKLVFKEHIRENLDDFVRRVFAFLRKNALRKALNSSNIDCIVTLAKEVFAQNDHPLVEVFIDELIEYGFQSPDIQGSTAEWQVCVHPDHIRCIRAWLEIIGLKPRWTKKLISALIVNLKIGGVFVRDTDLIQRDISRLLNSDISEAYNLIKQLLRLFPVYFSEIGAEGELRDITTRIDELSFRKDKLIGFFRKQSHVESNSLMVGFAEDIFRYWHSKDKQGVARHIPQEIFEQIPKGGIYVDGMHAIFSKLLDDIGRDPEKLLAWQQADIDAALSTFAQTHKTDSERAGLMIRIYQLIHKKYFPQHFDLIRDLEADSAFAQSDIQALKRTLRAKNYHRSLSILIKFITQLKERICAPHKTPSYENIYYKRHVAAGIPSMYGTYHEEKFDAMGLTLRLEGLATVLFEDLIRSLNLKFITKHTIIKIHSYIWNYVTALELEGIATKGLVSKISYVTSALQIKQFSIEQYIDIFRFISRGIQDILRDYYIDTHSATLPVIVRQLHPTPDSHPEEETIYKHSEDMIRSMIAHAFGLQVLDNFVHAVIKTLNAELEKFQNNKKTLNRLMVYNPELAVSSIYSKKASVDNQILLGNKGFFLKQLQSFGFPVPPGFIITTEVFRCYDAVYGYKYIFSDLAARVNREIEALEKKTRRRFGDPRNPLLLSVRSGATVSLPGMMRSFLNVGINEAVAESLSKKKNFKWAAWDSYRRFLQTWGMFQGLTRDFFDAIIEGYKQKLSVERKIQFTPDQMKKIALAYKQGILDSGIPLADDPIRQLRHAVLQVFDSWYSEQAKIYRQQMHLSDEWGTAVIVQAMVFGNLHARSGSGVIFTRDPKSGSADVTLYGDFIFGVQGDDIVSGLVETYPISEKQRLAEHRETDISLETCFPHIFAELVRIAEALIYERGFNHQEIEFTFEGPAAKDLYILQTRDMDQIHARKLRRFTNTSTLDDSLLGTGIGVSGGALSGRAVYSEAEIKHFRTTEPDTPLILIRPDTVPDDVGVLLQVEGLLTAKGGATSHAAVTIPQLSKVGVVGLGKLKVYEQDGYATIEGHAIRGGDLISIDGWTGALYAGRHETEIEKQYSILL